MFENFFVDAFISEWIQEPSDRLARLISNIVFVEKNSKYIVALSTVKMIAVRNYLNYYDIRDLIEGKLGK